TGIREAKADLIPGMPIAGGRLEIRQNGVCSLSVEPLRRIVLIDAEGDQKKGRRELLREARVHRVVAMLVIGARLQRQPIRQEPALQLQLLRYDVLVLLPVARKRSCRIEKDQW